MVKIKVNIHYIQLFFMRMLSRKCGSIVVAFLFISSINCYIGDDEEEEAATLELEQEQIFEETSVEKVGAYVTQITKKPFAVSLMINGTYICSGVILNAYWLLTVANCFDTHMIKSYVIEGNTDNFTARVGSNYNYKGGILYQIRSMLNNFDYRVTALKLNRKLECGPKVQAVSLPEPDSDPNLGYMATIVAWTPTGHIRAVNAPVIESTICDPYTNLLAGQYICLGGVQDPNKQFCRRDNGGAVIQNKTLIAVTTFSHTCAIYMKIHAFPKITKLLKWLDTIIWDDIKKPVPIHITTTKSPVILHKRKTINQPSREESYQNHIDMDESNKIPSRDQRQFPLPFKPMNLPLQPANNGVLPRMSLYESYLENKRRSAGQMVTFKPFYPPKKVLKKKVKSQNLSLNQQMSRLIDYDYDEKKYAKTSPTTVAATQKWSLVRNGVTSSHNLLKDSNQEAKTHIKPYANTMQTMNPKDLRRLVDYESYY